MNASDLRMNYKRVAYGLIRELPVGQRAASSMH